MEKNSKSENEITQSEFKKVESQNGLTIQNRRCES